MVRSLRTLSRLRSFLALILSLALTVQVSFAAAPTQTTVLADGRIEIELCSGAVMRTVLYDPQTGTYEDITSDEERAPYCPYCVVGPAMDAQAAPVFPARAVDLVKARFPQPALTLPADAQAVHLKPIRGPPTLPL